MIDDFKDSEEKYSMSQTVSPVIVVIAYNRPKALARLLGSLGNAEIEGRAKLILSLEGNATRDVRETAQQYSSPKFDKSIIQHQEPLGLRKHVMSCGDLALSHGAIIVLEDDLIVDRYFYHYARSAIEHYSEDTFVAGTALYSQEYNPYAFLPFRPMENGYSTFPMQVPCSSGQCWTSSQWRGFRDWYRSADLDFIESTAGLPQEVKKWPESSWKKYFAAYLVREKKKIIYPFRAYSTNCSDPGGTNVTGGTEFHQVAFASQRRDKDQFVFCPTHEADVAYDAYMEPCGTSVYGTIGLKDYQVEIDTYGTKPVSLLQQKDYCLTSKVSRAKAIRYYPRQYKPLEHNFSHPLPTGKEDALRLMTTRDLDESAIREPGLPDLHYYCSVNLESGPYAKAFFARLPKLFFRSALRRLRLGN